MKKPQEFVIVGAGPVGNWLAIEIARRNPQAKVTAYEKYPAYQRSHNLQVQHSSLLLYARWGADIHRQRFLEEITDHNLLGVFGRAARAVFVPTNVLERAMTTYANALGIERVTREITNPQELIDAHPSCTSFFAVDGAHSRMRKAVLGPDETALTSRTLQHVVEVKYMAESRAGHLDFLGEQYKTQKLLDNMAFEFVGREREGRTPVTLRFFVDADTYASLPQDMSFKKPVILDGNYQLPKDDPQRLPENLARDINTYLNAREQLADEKYMPGSGKVTRLMLNMYHAREFAVGFAGRNFHFNGDAALGVPYFRAFNAGIVGASATAFFVTRNWSARTQRRAHNAFGRASVAIEFSAATGKNSILAAYNRWRTASAASPLQFHKWGERQQADLRTHYHRAFTTHDDLTM